MIAYKWIGPAIIKGLPCSRAQLITLDYVKHFGFTENEMESWVNAGIFVKRNLPDNYDGPLSVAELNLFLERAKLTPEQTDVLLAKFNEYLDEKVEIKEESDSPAGNQTQELSETQEKKENNDVNHTSEVNAHA